MHRELGGTAILAVLAATLLSYGVARTVTRPLGAITATMREMASTGDLTRRIALSPNARWEDEDARLLATTFNSMTDSIERFQREAAQRERLSSLGRLSTVVAHEIRNPLMIIKTALRSLKQDPVQSAQVRAAVADIDEEVARLNRIVSEVLDFARPIKFELGPVDLNALAEDAARAVGATEGPAVEIRPELASNLPPVVTDGERLRLVLVNILTNARHAVLARLDRPGPRRDPAHHLHHRGGPHRPRGTRPGGRDRRRGSHARLRPVLHHAAHRNGAGSGDFPEYHRRTRRHDRRVEPARQRHGRAARAATGARVNSAGREAGDAGQTHQ